MLLKLLSWPLIQQSEIEGYTGTGMDLHVSVQDGATLYTRVLYLTVLSLSIGKPLFNHLYTIAKSNYIALL